MRSPNPNTVQALLMVVIAGALLLLVLRVLAWCIADVLYHAQDLNRTSRVEWLVLLLLFNVVAIPAYIGVGPSRDRWDPRLLWPWWRR